MTQFLPALRAHLKDRGWLKRFYLHISDEPSNPTTYGDHCRFVKNLAPEFQLIDAIGGTHIKCAQFVDHPVPWISEYENFLKHSGVPPQQIWFYYNCAPRGPWPCRVMDYPLIRTRIFTWAAFRYGTPGFLHWGLNFWRWFEFSGAFDPNRFDPYADPTCGALPAGEAYVIYPPRDPKTSDEPVTSIRWEIIRRAMDDYEYLYLVGQRARHGSRPAQALLRELAAKIVPTMATFKCPDQVQPAP